MFQLQLNMENITVTKIMDYLMRVGFINKSDPENIKIASASKFMTSAMLYNYYIKRSGNVSESSNTDTFLEKVFYFMKSNTDDN